LLARTAERDGITHFKAELAHAIRAQYMEKFDRPMNVAGLLETDQFSPNFNLADGGVKEGHKFRFRAAHYNTV